MEKLKKIFYYPSIYELQNVLESVGVEEIVFGWEIATNYWFEYKNGTTSIVNHEVEFHIKHHSTIPDLQFYIDVIIDKLASEDKLQRTRHKFNNLIDQICYTLNRPLNNLIIEHPTYNNIHLVNSVSDVIDLLSISVNRLFFTKDIFCIKNLISQLVNCKQKNINLQYYIEPSVPTYGFSDVKRLKQVLHNIIDNAIRYTKNGDVSLYVAADFVQSTEYILKFIISDTGPGIRKSIIENVYKPPELSSVKSISLLLSRLIIEKLGGELHIKSTPEGTIVNIELPTYECKPKKVDYNTLQKIEGKTVVILDDSKYRNILMEACTSCKLNTILVNSKDEYKVKIKTPPDLFIYQTDLKNSTDGIQLAKSMQSTKLLAVALDNRLLPTNLYHSRISLPNSIHNIKVSIISAMNTIHNFEKIILIIGHDTILNTSIEKYVRSINYTNVHVCSEVEYNTIENLKPDIIIADENLKKKLKDLNNVIYYNSYESIQSLYPSLLNVQ